MHLYKTKIQMTLTGYLWVEGESEAEADAKIQAADAAQIQEILGAVVEVESIDDMAILDHETDDQDET